MDKVGALVGRERVLGSEAEQEAGEQTPGRNVQQNGGEGRKAEGDLSPRLLFPLRNTPHPEGESTGVS